MTRVTMDEAVQRLRAAVENAGTCQAFADARGIDATRARKVLCGREKMSPQIAGAIGLRKVIMFEEIGNGR
jgi:hypothetical protein